MSSDFTSEAVTRRRRPGRPRSERSRRAILEATLQLLGEVGYGGISIEAIAGRAGAAKTTIYRHWDSKEELVAEALESEKVPLRVPDTGSLRGDFDALMDEAAEGAIDPVGRRTLALVVAGAAEDSRFRKLYWENYVLPRREALRRVLERARGRGETREDLDPDLVLDLLFGALFHRLLVDPSGGSVEEYLRRMVDEVLRGVAGLRTTE